MSCYEHTFIAKSDLSEIQNKKLIEKYGYEYTENDNTWIAQDNTFWENLDISQIKRYNFF